MPCVAHAVGRQAVKTRKGMAFKAVFLVRCFRHHCQQVSLAVKLQPETPDYQSSVGPVESEEKFYDI